MNYFSHYYFDHKKGNPYFNVGLVLPDFSRSAKGGPRKLNPKIQDLSETERSIWEGCLGHYKRDDWFHSSPIMSNAEQFFNTLFKNKNYLIGYKTWFVFHILTEMAIDRVMIKKFPLDLKEFYDDLNAVNLNTLAGFLIKCGKLNTDNFESFYNRFTQAEYLFYYIRDDKFCYSLNRVLTRSKQPEMSSAFSEDLCYLFPQIEDFLENQLLESGLL